MIVPTKPSFFFLFSLLVLVPSISIAAPHPSFVRYRRQAEDAQTSNKLDPSQVMESLKQDGQSGTVEPGQVRSLTSENNFINFCLTQDVPLTDGKQIPTGSCNQIPMGRILAVDKIPTCKFDFPPNGDRSIKENEAFTIRLRIQNMQTGFFANPASNYYANPQTVNDQGFLIGHSHVVIEQIPSFQHNEPLDPRAFKFFKGLNLAAADGILTADVSKGLAAGFYRMSSINSATTHQPALAPIAQHGSMDDGVYFEIRAANDNGVESASASASASETASATESAGASETASATESADPAASSAADNGNGNGNNDDDEASSGAEPSATATESAEPAASSAADNGNNNGGGNGNNGGNDGDNNGGNGGNNGGDNDDDEPTATSSAAPAESSAADNNGGGNNGGNDNDNGNGNGGNNGGGGGNGGDNDNDNGGNDNDNGGNNGGDGAASATSSAPPAETSAAEPNNGDNNNNGGGNNNNGGGNNDNGGGNNDNDDDEGQGGGNASATSSSAAPEESDGAGRGDNGRQRGRNNKRRLSYN